MPYKNEHSARIKNPNQFKTLKRVNDKFGSGIDVVFGKKTDDSPMEIQAIRFDKSKYSPDEAKDWLKENDIKATEFEESNGDDEGEEEKK